MDNKRPNCEKIERNRIETRKIEACPSFLSQSHPSPYCTTLTNATSYTYRLLIVAAELVTTSASELDLERAAAGQYRASRFRHPRSGRDQAADAKGRPFTGCAADSGKIGIWRRRAEGEAEKEQQLFCCHVHPHVPSWMLQEEGPRTL